MAKQIPTKPEDLERIAAELRRIAAMYTAGAAQMRELGLPEMEVNGLDTLVNTIIPRRLAANAGSVERALRNYRATGLLSAATDASPDLDADEKKTRRKVSSRRKKKDD